MGKIRDTTLRILKGDPVSVGLDIGNHSVKIVYIKHHPNGPILEGAGIHVFAEPVLENGEITNREELLYSLSSLIKKTDPKLKFKEVNFGLSWSYGVIADRIKLRINADESEDELILMEANRRSPFDVDDIQLDYKILSKNTNTEEMEVLLVAAKQKRMQPFLDVIREAGLDPINVDVDTFAVANSYFYTADPQDKTKVICLINIGEFMTNLTFIKNGVYHSTRDIATGGRFFAQTIRRELGVKELDSVNILKGRYQGNIEEEIVQKCIENCAEELSIGIDLAFSYFKSSENNAAIDKIIICGGGASIEGLPEFLADRHNMEVEIGDPLSQINADSKKFPTAIPQDVSTSLMVATGLALRKFP